MPKRRGICAVPDCGQPHQAKGYCELHYRRLLLKGTIEPPDPRKTGYLKNGERMLGSGLYVRWRDFKYGRGFPAVKEWHDDFWVFYADVGDRPSKQHRLYPVDRRLPLGPSNFEWRYVVSVDKKTGEDPRATRRRVSEARKEFFGTTQLDSQLRKKFGADFGLADLKKMLLAQKGLCVICGEPETARGRKGGTKLLAVDHDHQTNKVRELLCQACNRMLGYARDNRAILLAGVAYLDKHEAKAYPIRTVGVMENPTLATPAVTHG